MDSIVGDNKYWFADGKQHSKDQKIIYSMGAVISSTNG